MIMKKDAIVQNLKDAGCPASTIENIMEQTGGSPNQKRILNAHRKSLLDTIHEHQKKLDCLDYLLFQLDKERR